MNKCSVNVIITINSWIGITKMDAQVNNFLVDSNWSLGTDTLAYVKMFQVFMCDVATSQKADGSPGISICFFHLVNSDAYIRFPNTSSAHAIHCNYRELCKSTNRALAVAMVTGLSSGGLQCSAIFHFNKNYVCFKGQVWAHNHIDIQFIWLH